jgi:hypothetical protein
MKDLKSNHRRLKRKAMSAAAVAAFAAGAVIVAVPAATGHSAAHAHRGTGAAPRHHGHHGAHIQGARSGAARGEIATAASYLGLSTARLRSDLRSGETLAQVAQANGKSTAGLIDALVSARTARLPAESALSKSKLAKIRARIAASVNRVRTAPSGVALSAAAHYLGVKPAQLHRELRSGETLAQIAGATAGKSPAGLIAALTSAAESRLAGEVASGALSAKREKKLLSTVARRVASEVGRSHKSGAGPR